jgi:hypothetical protein
MKRLILNLTLMLAPVASFAVVINFDDISTPTGSATWQGNRYIGQNLMFSADEALGAVRYSADMALWNMVGGSSQVNGSVLDEEIEWRYTTAANAALATNSVSFVVRRLPNGVISSGSTWDARAYDIDGNELDRARGNSFNTTVTFNRATADIHRVVFKPSGGNEGIDGLTFNPPTAVPEPGTMAAVTLGVGSLVARRRRKRA